MAVEECIANDILREFLVRNKTGVMRMLFGKEDWERHKQREMKALAEEIERRVQLELERRTTINIICDSLEKLGEVPEDLRRILGEQKNSAILRNKSE